MPWFSLLPEQLSIFEVWAVRFFLFLGLLVIGPWLALLVYDFIYYCWRTATYDVPVIGGRARGRQRPRAPSLTERPSGIPRRFSLSATPSPHREESPTHSGAARTRKTPASPGRRYETTFED